VTAQPFFGGERESAREREGEPKNAREEERESEGEREREGEREGERESPSLVFWCISCLYFFFFKLQARDTQPM